MGRITGLLRLIAGRLRAEPGLLAIRLCGIFVAVALVAAVSLYSTAMGDAMLQASLNADPGSRYLTVSNIQQTLSPQTYGRLDSYIRHQLPRDLGLPLLALHVHHYTSTLDIYRVGSRNTRITVPVLAQLSLHYYEGFAGQVRIVAGRLDLAARAPDGSVPILVSQFTARSLHLRLGDHLALSVHHHHVLAPRMIVAGIYVPRQTSSAFWDTNAGLSDYRSLVVLRLPAFLSLVADKEGSGPAYLWTFRTTVGTIRLSGANRLLDAIQGAGSRLATIAPGTTLLTSIDGDINSFDLQYNLLPYILLILVAPIVVLILYAVAVTAALVLDRQGGEIVLLRSRGASTGQIFLLSVLEGVLLGAVAALVGPLAGLPLAGLIARASGFLTFGGGLPVVLRLDGMTYLLAAATALLGLLAGLLPALVLSRRSMLAFKQEQARQGRRPLWQRLFLDVVVLAVALYGLFVLARQGPVTSGASTAAIVQDPVIAVTPLLFAVALTLFISRILPWLATAGLFVLGRLSSPSAHVALQSVARAPRLPMRLVQLCTLTLTLGVFAATVAGVEASNRADQQMYDAGAPLRLVEIVDTSHSPNKNISPTLPLSWHLRLPGVHAATPALRFETSGNIANVVVGTTVNVLGVDPATAGRVMWFRPDFADQPFRRLLSLIARPGPRAIVSDSFLRATGLRTDDAFDVDLSNNTTVHLQVAAAAHYFPSLDPQEMPFVVTNLAYLQRASKSHGPNEVWLNCDHNMATINRILSITSTWPRQIIAYQGLAPHFAAQDEPLTAGIYGVVSIGFLIAVGLALLGFIAYAYLSLQRRLPEFAIVRALGLSSGGVRSLLLFEQLFLLGAGVLGGIVAGILTTQLFLPYLPFATHTMPPFLVTMPWRSIGVFVLAVIVVFAAVLSLHVSMLLRVQLGRVLRLGE